MGIINMINKLIALAGLLATTTQGQFCNLKGEVDWKQYTRSKAKKVAANANTKSVYIMKNSQHKGGFGIAKIDVLNNAIKDELTIKKGGKNWEGTPIAVSSRGSPSYIDANKKLHMKLPKKGWTIYGENDMKLCAYSLAYGADGSIISRDCWLSKIWKLDRKT